MARPNGASTARWSYFICGEAKLINTSPALTKQNNSCIARHLYRGASKHFQQNSSLPSCLRIHLMQIYAKNTAIGLPSCLRIHPARLIRCLHYSLNMAITGRIDPLGSLQQEKQQIHNSLARPWTDLCNHT